MAYTRTAPRTQNITGADLTGADGATNRTYTIPDAGVLSSGVDIAINGTQLHEGASNDFTLSGETITFLNNVDNPDIIRINYFIALARDTQSTITTTTTLKYATTLQFAAILGILRSIPTWDDSTNPTNIKEEVGTGDNSETRFYLDHKNILSDSYTLYYGSASTTTDELTETTHYTINQTTGAVTLTSAGVTLVGTNKIYATYSYCFKDFSDEYLVAVLGRAEKEVDGLCNTTFTDGTATNPDYPSRTEIQPTMGQYQQDYFTDEKPLIDVSSTLSADITAAATSIALATGDGDKFPSTGTIIIGSEKITYTGVSTDTLTGCTRGVGDSTAATHSEDDEVHTTVLELSGTSEGTAPTWEVQPWNSDMFANADGKIFIYRDSLSSQVTAESTVLHKTGVANRFKLTYLYGYDSVPVDITRLTLLLGKRMLIQDSVGGAMVKGRNEFRPEMMNADAQEIRSIVGTYKVVAMGNT